MSRIARAISLLLIGCCIGSAAAAQGDDAPLPEQVDFNEHIRPIFNANCAACHSGVKAASGVSFVFRSMAVKTGDSGQQVIAPGNPGGSAIMQRITSDDDPMPPAGHGSRLTPHEVQLIERWIEQGAHWADHWAYLAPQQQRVPNVSSSTHHKWVRGDIDRFILARLDSEGLAPNAQAQPGKLLRRVAIDLTGLPPTVAELDAFLASYESDPHNAVEREVDRLLASPHFGERWAAMWMDLARFADSTGYEADHHRDIWPYRDWLIDSFDSGKPYDQFIIEQMAGDLLPDATFEQVIATAFHRNTQTNNEGGTDNEEFRVLANIDRVNTTWEVLQGTTMRCVQCHSHAYDPIQHEEYYRAYALLNNTQDNDDFDYPLLRVAMDPEQRDDVLAVHRESQSLTDHLTAVYASLVSRTAWAAARVGLASTDGDGSLVVEDDNATLHADGTIPWNASYEIELAGDAQPRLITAIRIDALLDGVVPGQADQGFAISQVMLQHDPESEPIELALAGTDWNRSDANIANVLMDNADGWSTYPNTFHPHWLVLVPAAPIELAAGESLHVTLRHLVFRVGNDGTLKRVRISLTGDPAWAALAGDEQHHEQVASIAHLRAMRDQVPGVSVPVMAERSRDVVRDTYVFERGNWMTHGQKVEPGTPAMLPGLDMRADESPRLAFARWLASPQNPLTARVFVNRIWFELFGTGIVRTLGDFGTQGERPSHPALLDHLAMRFMHGHDWRLRPLLREIVLSAVYQQDAFVSSEKWTRDPKNRLLARGPRVRLAAEMIRDQALRVSGLMSEKMHGPSVMPPQPDGVWQTVYSGEQWKPATGEDANRRALYTYWKRTSPYPSMLTFDTPTREVCTAQRIATNTPLQALITLNDPVYVACAEALATRMIEAGNDDESRLAFGYRAVTCVEVPQDVLDELKALYDQAAEAYEGEANPQHAAMTIVASTLLNMDDALVK